MPRWVEKRERFTAFADLNGDDGVTFPQEFTGIDHILLSLDLWVRVTGAWIPHDPVTAGASDHFPVVVRLLIDPTPPPPVIVRMTSLVPNPVGNDDVNEEVTLKNFGTQPVSMFGWRLRDLVGRFWYLDRLGILQPGEEKAILRRDQAGGMQMNNDTDAIELLDASGVVVQRIPYRLTGAFTREGYRIPIPPP